MASASSNLVNDVARGSTERAAPKCIGVSESNALTPARSFASNPGGRLRFTSDGAAIAYVSRDGANLWALPLDGGEPRQITQFPAPGNGASIVSFAWSTDGTRLAILRATTTNDIVLFRGLR